jgi:hypothetical protein
MTGTDAPVQISPEQIEIDTAGVVNLAHWHLHAGRLPEALAVIVDAGPWIGWCQQIVTRRAVADRVHHIIADLEAHAVAERRQRKTAATTQGTL